MALLQARISAMLSVLQAKYSACISLIVCSPPRRQKTGFQREVEYENGHLRMILFDYII